MEESSLQYFIEAFAEADKERKIDLIDRICKHQNEKVLHFLVSCLADEHWIIRKRAAEHIEIYKENAASVLSSALNSYNEDIQHWSLKILSKIGEKGMPAILRSMKSTNSEVRYFACNALGKIRCAQGVTALLKALGDERWRVRKAASDSLAKYGEAVITPLQQVLKITSDEDIRFWAIKTLGKLGPNAQKFLLDALKSGEKKTRYVIAAALGESGDQRVIKVLIESLADPDWTIRKSATMALAEIGENAVEQMTQYLKGPNELIRDGCLRALVKTGNNGLRKLFDEIIRMDENHRYLIRNSIVRIGSRVVEPLIRLFKFESPDVLCFSASALGEIGNPRAVPVLINGLSNEDWNVRRTCAYALGEIGERGVEHISEALKNNNDDVRYWVTKVLESMGEPGIPFLVKALKDSNREIRYFAAKALRTSMDPSVARPLINCLADNAWGVRKAAAESICSLENPPIEVIIRHISSDNEDIRHWVRKIIEKIGGVHIEKITEAIAKGDAELRLFACQAAGLIDAPELIEPLITALRDDSEWVRTYAAISLGRTGDKRAIAPLIRSFSDRNADVHRNIIKSFKNLGNEVYIELKKAIESNDPSLRSNAAIAFGEMRYQPGLDSIILLADDSLEHVRASAAEALGFFNCLKSASVLQKALKDECLNVRLAAVKALGKINEPQQIRMLIEHAAKSKDERETRTTKRTLVEMAEYKPDLFIQLFNDEQAVVKNTAYEALAGAGIAVIGKLSEVIVESKDSDLVFWCKKTLKKIKQPKEIGVYGTVTN